MELTLDSLESLVEDANQRAAMTNAAPFCSSNRWSFLPPPIFFLEAVERSSTNGGAIDCEYRLLFPDGRLKHLHILAKPLRRACVSSSLPGRSSI
jgi:hypothetical protein